MVKIAQESLTVTAINKYYSEKEQRYSRRLGASQIGKLCDRQLWYSFRWALPLAFKGRMIRLFDTGHREEARMIEDLQNIGVKVYPLDDRTGEQFTYIACDGHFVAKLDGVCIGLPEAEKTWHVLEIKTHNDRSFSAVCSKGLYIQKPEHYAQCQVEMHLTGLKRAFYLAKNKNNDALYGLRLEYNKEECLAYLEHAKTIINASGPPVGNSEYSCRWCDYKTLCKGKELPQRNCRTCLHSTPVSDGEWTCSKAAQIRAYVNKTEPTDYPDDVVVIDIEQQIKGCKHHLFIPALVNAVAPVKVTATGIQYQRNGGSLWWDGVE